ncbi:hypothetical protein CRE_23674 [Caenorhabditis remanei]|uniref:Uncharacterized protein n=1 Tax=Caenorhabditis remanei TaxID=31234 RepID=E3N496_CAERE|nr:hypothetical protein CRE_23674 [Caenorhabditis remanei]
MPDVITTTVSALETPQVPSKYQTARNASKVYSDSISRRTQYSSKCTCTSPYHTNESFYHSQFKTYRNQVRWVMGGFVVFRQPLYLNNSKPRFQHALKCIFYRPSLNHSSRLFRPSQLWVYQNPIPNFMTSIGGGLKRTSIWMNSLTTIARSC